MSTSVRGSPWFGTSGPMLAHKAEDEATVCLQRIVGG